jgi:hypothetical protein
MRLDGDVVYGVSDGVGFSICEEDGGKLTVFMLTAKSDSSLDELEAVLSQNRNLSELQVGDVEGYLALFYDESQGNMPHGLMDEMLNFIGTQYRNYGFRAPNVCVVCSAPANKRAFYNNIVQPMCADCSAENNRRQAEEKRKAEERKQKREVYGDEDYGTQPLSSGRVQYDEEYDEYAGMESRRELPSRHMPAENDYVEDKSTGDESMGKGLLGAGVGAIGGVILYGITALASFPVSGLCALSGVLAVLGYAAFGGLRAKGKATGVILGVSAVVDILFVFLFSLLFQMNSSGLSASSAMTIMSGSIIELILNLSMAVIAMLLGYVLAGSAMRRYVND